MKIGVPKEIKNHEYRVGLTPASVRELTLRGHGVLVEKGAGAAIGLSDEQYLAAGAQLAPDAAAVDPHAGHPSLRVDLDLFHEAADAQVDAVAFHLGTHQADQAIGASLERVHALAHEI